MNYLKSCFCSNQNKVIPYQTVSNKKNWLSIDLMEIIISFLSSKQEIINLTNTCRYTRSIFRKKFSKFNLALILSKISSEGTSQLPNQNIHQLPRETIRQYLSSWEYYRSIKILHKISVIGLYQIITNQEGIVNQSHPHKEDLTNKILKKGQINKNPTLIEDQLKLSLNLFEQLKGLVFSLDLKQQNLTFIPLHLKSLEHLEELNLSCNNLIDISILRNITNLKNLNLSNNKIIDISIICHLTSLEVLNVSNNFITTIPEDFKNLKFLESLIIDNNKLKKIPANLYYLPYLHNISAQNNEITKTQDDLAGIQTKKIKGFNNIFNSKYLTLNLCHNTIVKVPNSLYYSKIRLELDEQNLENNDVIDLHFHNSFLGVKAFENLRRTEAYLAISQT